MVREQECTPTRYKYLNMLNAHSVYSNFLQQFPKLPVKGNFSDPLDPVFLKVKVMT